MESTTANDCPNALEISKDRDRLNRSEKPIAADDPGSEGSNVGEKWLRSDSEKWTDSTIGRDSGTSPEPSMIAVGRRSELFLTSLHYSSVNLISLNNAPGILIASHNAFAAPSSSHDSLQRRIPGNRDTRSELGSGFTRAQPFSVGSFRVASKSRQHVSSMLKTRSRGRSFESEFNRPKRQSTSVWSRAEYGSKSLRHLVGAHTVRDATIVVLVHIRCQSRRHHPQFGSRGNPSAFGGVFPYLPTLTGSRQVAIRAAPSNEARRRSVGVYEHNLDVSSPAETCESFTK